VEEIQQSIQYEDIETQTDLQGIYENQDAAV